MRDNLVAALSARLERVREEQDPSAVLEPEAPKEAALLSQALSADGGQDLEARWVLGWFHWTRVLSLPPGNRSQDHDRAVEAFWPFILLGGTASLPEQLLPVLADRAFDTASDLAQKALASDDPSLTAAVVEAWRNLAGAIPADHRDRALYLGNLGAALLLQSERTGAGADLDEAIDILRSVAATAVGDPSRAGTLANLAAALQLRFGRTAVGADLDEAIEMRRKAVTATPAGDPNLTRMLSDLSGALLLRFEGAGVIADLDEIVQVEREAMAATSVGHPRHIMHLAQVGLALQLRSERTGREADLDEAIKILRQVASAIPVGRRDRASDLANLSDALLLRHERTSAAADLDEAIKVRRKALAATPADHPDRLSYLAILAHILHERSERTEAQADLDEIVQLRLEMVTATPVGHPDRAMNLAALAFALEERFERTGEQADLDEAIKAARDAEAITSPGRADHAGALASLAIALRRRFERTGSTADLDDAIQLGRDAVTGLPAGQPDYRTTVSNLGLALWLRYQRTGLAADLDEAIMMGRELLAAERATDPSHALHLANLSAMLGNRHARTGSEADLGEAVQLGREAVAATPTSHPDRARRLSNLATTLMNKVERAGPAADVDEAVGLWREAVAATPADHPNRAQLLTDFAAGLSQTGVAADLDEAIEAGREAVTVIPADHPGRAGCLANLGGLLRMRIERTGPAADLDEMISCYAEAADLDVAAPSLRLASARTAASLLGPASRQAARLLETAVELLGEVTPRQLNRGDQQFALSSTQGLAAMAASYALASAPDDEPGRAGTAFRLLEQGRAVILSQALDSRSDLSDLKAAHRELGLRYEALRDRLAQSSASGLQALAGPSGPATGAGAASRRGTTDPHVIAREFAAVTAQIRRLDGFTGFMLPPPLRELTRQALQGPVVAYNISQDRSDALILRPNGVTCVRLKRLVFAELVDRINDFYQKLSDARNAPGLRDRAHAEKAILDTLAWLWRVAAAPVLDQLGFTTRPTPENAGPRVWWAPGGLLGLLPIHAAGDYLAPATSPDRLTVMDRVISSYTPSVRALRYARQHASTRPPSRALIVAMPTTPGMPDPLRHVSEEAQQVRRHFADACMSVDGRASTPTVIEQLKQCQVAHFACHGVSDAADPSRSGLLLSDHGKDRLTVARLGPVYQERAQLAYLSACETAFNPSADLRDESIDLASAFLLAGFPHVIGTLWPVDEQVSVTVADSFYQGLRTRDGGLDTTRSAQALHFAILHVRDTLNWARSPSLWASYMHAGA